MRRRKQEGIRGLTGFSFFREPIYPSIQPPWIHVSYCYIITYVYCALNITLSFDDQGIIPYKQIDMNLWENMMLGAMDPKDRLWIGVSLGVLFVVIVAAFIVLGKLRNRLHSTNRDSPLRSTFTLEQLRQMHREGQISDEEYHNLRDTTFSDSGVSK